MIQITALSNNTPAISDKPLISLATTPPPKLLDQVRERIRLKHYSLRTEQAYVSWIKRYIYFHGKRHPRNMGKAQIEAFLSALAVERNVSASTQSQSQALAAGNKGPCSNMSLTRNECAHTPIWPAVFISHP